MLIVAPSGSVKAQVLFDTFAFSFTTSIVKGSVADELAVENAVKRTGSIAFK